MHVRRSIWCTAWFACLGLALPVQPLFAQAPAPPAKPAPRVEPAPAMADIALRDSGGLSGFVVDAQGLPMFKVDVAVVQSGNVVTTTKTNDLGQFTTTPLRGGVYQVVAAQGTTTLRVWEQQAAPPSARPLALVVGNDQVVRGQIPFRQHFFSDAFVLAAIVAAAIAIPVAISSARNPQPSSS